MKGSIFAAAAVVGSALADGNLHRRHDALHNKRAVGAPAPVDSSSAVATPSSNPGGPLEPAPADETCGCTTKVITVWGSPTLVPIPQTSTEEETSTSTSTVHSTSTSTKTLTVTPSASVAPTSVVPTTSTVYVSLPTNGVTSFSTTGTYTVPATTLTVTESTTVCGATTTNVPSGTHTVGGVTTVVETDTVITCPYATVKPTGTTHTSVIEYTTYTCPAAGTYTVVPGTVTTVPSSTVIVYPTPSTLTPGTYTKPETTITATRTDTTFYCPFSEETTSAPAVAPTTAPAPVTTTAAATTSAPAPAATTSASSGGSGSGLTGEGQYGMTFSPYTESGACMTQDEVKKNLQTIKDKGFNLVRIYSTDCSGLEFVGEAAKELGLKMIVGVYIDSSGQDKAQEQVDAIAKWAQWSLVELIVVGNEAASMGYMDAKTLGLFIQSSAAQFKSAGWTGKVTTTEPIDIWQASGKADLCPYVDIVGANIHPFFNAQTSASAAGTFALSEYKLLEAICGKDVINLETGWPNAGSANGAAVPSVENQKTAVKAIAKAIGSKSIFFSYADDAWKPAGEFGVENHWGCASVF